MLQETTAFIENINEVHQSTGAKSISKKQIRFLSACICAICWFGKISWASFERFFLGISVLRVTRICLNDFQFPGDRCGYLRSFLP